MSYSKYHEENSSRVIQEGDMYFLGTYDDYDNNYHAGSFRHNRRCIDGSVTNSGNCVGYCTYCGHQGFITSALRKKHDCIHKGCNYYVPKTNKCKTPKVNCFDSKQLVDEINSILEFVEGIKVMRADKRNNTLILHYIAITNDYSISELISAINKKIDYDINFRRLDYDFDVCVKLILK